MNWTSRDPYAGGTQRPSFTPDTRVEEFGVDVGCGGVWGGLSRGEIPCVGESFVEPKWAKFRVQVLSVTF